MEVEPNLHIMLYGLLGKGKKYKVIFLIGSLVRNESELNIVI